MPKALRSQLCVSKIVTHLAGGEAGCASATRSRSRRRQGALPVRAGARHWGRRGLVELVGQVARADFTERRADVRVGRDLVHAGRHEARRRVERLLPSVLPRRGRVRVRVGRRGRVRRGRV